MDPRDAYRILHVDPAADPDVIRAAYRVLVRKLHPDGRLDRPESPTTARRMADLTWAYGVLRDAESRRQYDRERRFAGPIPGADAADAAGSPASHGRPRPDLASGPGATRLDFGRYEGLTLREVLRRDPAYLEWLSRHASGARHRQAISQLLRERPDRT